MLQQSSRRVGHAARLHAAHRRRLPARRSPASRWVMMQDQALGSLVEKDGKVIGSSLVGQSFTSERYFHPRPSATSGADPADASKTVDAPYNAAASTGSNLGPITKKLLDRVQGSVDELRKEGVAGPIPVDAVTASSSGLDPRHLAGECPAAGGARRQGPRPTRGAGARPR